jgi:hypothetical protein
MIFIRVCVCVCGEWEYGAQMNTVSCVSKTVLQMIDSPLSLQQTPAGPPLPV